MKWHRTLLFVLLVCVVSITDTQASMKRGGTSLPSREFDFTYCVTLSNLPKETELLRIWIPVAKTTPHQTVKLLKMSSTVPLRITHESEYGNRMAYAEIQHPRFETMNFTLIYRDTRQEYSVGSFGQLMREVHHPVQISPELTRFVQPDRLIPIDGEIEQIAAKATAGQQGEIANAHAIYDYVFHNMRYDKSGTGWGRGDAVWACDAKHGNCTDFHSLFIGMLRAEHIPARFEIGFPLPPDKLEGAIPGYHCWAEFYVADKGWIPVDLSEAWLDPTQYGFFFGSVDANRFRFSAGRDITLEPKQSGPPINYFVYPYVELDGKPYSGFHQQFSFRDVSH